MDDVLHPVARIVRPRCVHADRPRRTTCTGKPRSTGRPEVGRRPRRALASLALVRTHPPLGVTVTGNDTALETTATAYTTMPSPIGELLLTTDGKALTRLLMSPFEIDPAWTRDEAALRPFIEQLDDYFAGKRRDF